MEAETRLCTRVVFRKYIPSRQCCPAPGEISDGTVCSVAYRISSIHKRRLRGAQSTFLVYNTSLRCAIQVRLFGDPKNGGSEVPTLVISVNARFESPSVPIRRETSHDVAPDFVEGFAFGDALGVGLRCLSTSSWTVTALTVSHELREAVRVQRTRRVTGRLTYSALI